ncbi:PTS sugar transporter subunit IIB [Vibrio gazogenes]|uniref:PTS system, cellobiose-specific IIB component n=2 Tax=Vibrio gazogenes TaxID=687 RepID=A0A1M4TXF1_VIBGA|nr:PTS sugar transporter subunit IIB [Vibrio gazogenes]ASA57284.1 PTS sugar transporter subunit IIB [Vibrio gazogenes]USP16183.1 PTS sugar transporter subunit IIB [Vibrio gazogenes]SHE49159.1 PTS system, cellobiose-specific IIB component [Vibrio gazogenes DSM 21264] [Vibrio gazogenes DSM 21264 = NBRC 103151]SJN53072.1 Lichenan-specific phosphotransferase enzyme IIB component [Vibrio gazogenes]
MINIILICAAGMSTSMLMQKMKDSAEKRNLDISVLAMPEGKLDSYKENIDILLLGPQIMYLEDKIRGIYEEKGVKVAVIDMVDYGSMNGDKVLDDALLLLG